MLVGLAARAVLVAPLRLRGGRQRVDSTDAYAFESGLPRDVAMSRADPISEAGTQHLADQMVQSQARTRPARVLGGSDDDAKANSPGELRIDPSRYRSASQGPRQNLPVTFEEIDRVIDRATRTDGMRPVIPQFQGESHWARTQWKGTIVQHLWRPAAWSLLLPLLLMVAAKLLVPSARWLPSPDHEHALFAATLPISHAWGHLLTLTTFTTTFFLGHAHTFWRKCYGLSRTVQGRINDVGLLCGATAARAPDGTIDPDAARFLSQIARQLRLSHLLFWSDVVYRRTVDKGASFRTLLSAPGLYQLHARGLLDAREYATLLAAQLPPSRWYLVVLEWVMAGVANARREGLLVGSPGMEATVLQKLCELRSSMTQIPDELAARIPLAYVHFTTLLVDALLALSPLALLPRLGAFTVVLGPIIVIFYSGLLELSKSFLDPFGNRRVSTTDLSAEVNIDTLLGESNAASLIWPSGSERMPFLARREERAAEREAARPAAAPPGAAAAGAAAAAAGAAGAAAAAASGHSAAALEAAI